MTKKTYDRTTICFGEKGDPARIIKDKISEYYGKAALSSQVRRAIVVCYGNKPEFKDYKIKIKMFELQEAIKEMTSYAKKRNQIKEDLQTLGLSDQEIEDKLMQQ